MNFRSAVPEDLPQLRTVFGEIIKDMYANGIPIWDEYYPCELFPEDIEKGELFVLTDGEIIAAAFALGAENEGAGAIRWENPGAKALYFDRFGVNVHYRHQGVGGLALSKAVETARQMGADVLRLFVVDSNTPAIKFYLKQGCRQAEGIYNEEIDEETTLQEFGFEIKTGK